MVQIAQFLTKWSSLKEFLNDACGIYSKRVLCPEVSDMTIRASADGYFYVLRELEDVACLLGRGWTPEGYRDFCFFRKRREDVVGKWDMSLRGLSIGTPVLDRGLDVAAALLTP